jgi:isochorismate pyruvate lyase
MSVKPTVPSVNLPDDCHTMAEVRAGVDAVDLQLIALLARRFGYMDAASRIKTSRDAVRDEERKAEVIANVCSEALALGLPQELLAALWNDLVEGSIAYELDRWDSANTLKQS